MSMSPLSLLKHIANGKTIELPASVVCTHKLYKVLCQHIPQFQTPLKSLRNPPGCIAHHLSQNCLIVKISSMKAIWTQLSVASICGTSDRENPRK